MLINTPNIAAVLLLITSAGMSFVNIYSVIGVILAIAFIGYRVWKALKEYPLRVSAALRNLSLCMEDITNFRHYFADGRKKKDYILRLLNYF